MGILSHSEAILASSILLERSLKSCKKKKCPHHFSDFNLDKVFCIKNIFIMNDVTDFRKTVETGVDRAFSDSFDTVRACNIVK